MNKNVTNFFNNAKTVMSKRSPEILTGIGVAGMITTTILAVKATPKALKLIEEKKKEENKDKLTVMETVKVAWKPYVPTVATGLTAIGCVIGASSVNARRNAALATAYQLSATAFNEYKEKVVETIGEKKVQAVKDKIAKDKVEKTPMNESQIIITNSGDTLCLDSVSKRHFKSDIEKIRKAVNDLNSRMIGGEMYISLNEFYGEIGLEPIGIGDDLGWNIHESGIIEVDFSSQITEDGKPCLVMDFLVAPRYDFSKLM